jgi:hypothetical protein
MTVGSRRLLGLALVAVVVGAAAGVLVPRLGDAWRMREARRRGEQLHRDWMSMLSRAADPERTYVAVAGTSGPAWTELLVAAGLPQAAMLSAADDALPAGYRLVVWPARSAGPDPAVLASVGRAVIVLEQPERAADVALARMTTGALLPLAGAPIRILDVLPGERAFLTADGGGVLGTVRACGQGLVVRLGLDLAAHLMRLRLGLPSRAGQDRDGNGELQPADLLEPIQGELSSQPWADIVIDELLSVIATEWPGCPLPRTRGLPAGMGAVVVISADQDYASDQFVELMATRLEERGARATFLLTDPQVGLAPDLNRDASGRAPWLASSSGDSLVSRGFGLGLHPFPRTASDLIEMAAHFTQRHGLVARVTRNHHLRWPDYDGMPRAAATAGAMLDLNLMPVSVAGRPAVGFPTGSARPVRMTDATGALLPLLQQPTSVDDYSLRIEDAQARSRAARALWTLALDALKQVCRVQAPLVVNAHPMLHAFAPDWLDPLLGAQAVHAISADRWLEFVVDRRKSRLALPACGHPTVQLEAQVELHE